MKLILADPNAEMCDAWCDYFQANAEVRESRFETITDADTLVTAGNSFGLMDGGVDLAVAQAFPGIEVNVQQRIRINWYGELPVGAALTAPIGIVHTTSYWRVIYAPTMRVPLDIRGTDNVYRAMWAALIEAGRSNVQALVVPGLGTGAGQVPPNEAARQMSVAWRHFNDVPDRIDWAMANNRHHDIDATCCRS